MITLPLLAAHTGAHAAAHAAPLAVLPLFFRRAIAAVRRKPAVPAGVTAGTATTLLADRFPCCPCCEDGYPCDPRDSHLAPCGNRCNDPVLGDRMLAGVRRERDGLSPAQAAAHADKARAAAARWYRPVNGRYLGTLPRRTPAATLNRAPWETGAFTVPGDVTLVPACGQPPVARVLEAERLNQVMQP